MNELSMLKRHLHTDDPYQHQKIVRQIRDIKNGTVATEQPVVERKPSYLQSIIADEISKRKTT